MTFDDIQVMSLRDQQKIRNGWQENRLQNLLPALMEEHGLDMWIVACKEDNQDPVLSTLLPQGLSADENVVLPPVGNQIIIVFSLLPQGKVERLLISSLKLRDLYENIWDERTETDWECLSRIIKEKNPKKIGINISETFSHADGLTFNQYKLLLRSIGSHANRVTSAEKLVVKWLQQRIPEELDFYPHIAEIGHAIIAKAFTNEIVIPGTTSVEDVGWWIRQCIRDHGLSSWFKPMVGMNRKGQQHMELSGVIQPGDMLFCDVGLNYMGLLTDTQRQAYVLNEDEMDVPDGLTHAMTICNQLQDIFLKTFKAGKSGNEILSQIHEQAKKDHIEALISAHPIGTFGHGPGAPIGVWNQQNGVPGRGDYLIPDNTCYAMELCAICSIPQWDMQRIPFHLEQTIMLQNQYTTCLDSRQTEFYIIS
ncbi:MAG: M24 family metallopeptidase [Caldisericia bacterium]|nr:M24 family metallopeptidase [Caldisericia bacterium]MDD4614639.1 M24 family metallopeptidase [Caldisericia bacterium]